MLAARLAGEEGLEPPPWCWGYLFFGIPALSKKTVDGLACPPGKDGAFIWDSALAGFGVAAFASGKKAHGARAERSRFGFVSA